MSSSDDPRAVAYNPAAPASERYDAETELSKSAIMDGPLATTLFGAEDIRPIIDHIMADLQEQDLRKAQAATKFSGRISPVPTIGPRSVMIDDLTLNVMGEYFEKPTNINLLGLRMMVWETPILNSIVMTRIRQISRFCSPSEDGGLGFEIRHVDRNHQMSDQDRDAAALLSKFIQNCGWEFNPRERLKMGRDNFATFMSKSIRDTMSMDAQPVETEWKRDKSKGIDGFYAIDGSTIRLCTDKGFDGDDKVFAVQVIDQQVTCAYTHDQLIYPVRNPMADVTRGAYGLGEPELLIRVVTGFLNAMTHTMKGLDENSIPKGLLHLSGNYGADDLAAMKRYWAMTVKGAGNAFNLPMLISKDQESRASFERFGIEFNEMYFSKWLSFLTAIACAIYAISPDEINFESFAASKSSLSGSDTEEKLADSKDRGLRPLLSHYESWITDYVLSDFTDQFCFRFAGLDPEEPAQKWEREKLTLTLDEMRKKDGRDPFPDAEMGSCPMNPSLVSVWMQLKQGAQQQQQGQDQGDFGNPDEQAQGGAQPNQAAQPGQDDADEPDADEPGQDAAVPPAAVGGGEFGGKPAGGDFGKALRDSALQIFAVGD